MAIDTLETAEMALASAERTPGVVDRLLAFVDRLPGPAIF